MHAVKKYAEKLIIGKAQAVIRGAQRPLHQETQHKLTLFAIPYFSFIISLTAKSISNGAASQLNASQFYGHCGKMAQSMKK